MEWGIVKLFQSSKGTLSLIILACATVAVMFSKIDGMSYAAVVGTIGSIFMYTRMKSDCAHANLPERGQ